LDNFLNLAKAGRSHVVYTLPETVSGTANEKV